MQRQTRDERQTQPPARPGLLDLLTSGIGTAWGLLAAARFFAGLIFPQADAMNLLFTYYVVLALALAHLIDGIRSWQTTPRSQER